MTNVARGKIENLDSGKERINLHWSHVRSLPYDQAVKLLIDRSTRASQAMESLQKMIDDFPKGQQKQQMQKYRQLVNNYNREKHKFNTANDMYVKLQRDKKKMIGKDGGALVYFKTSQMERPKEGDPIYKEPGSKVVVGRIVKVETYAPDDKQVVIVAEILDKKTEDLIVGGKSSYTSMSFSIEGEGKKT